MTKNWNLQLFAESDAGEKGAVPGQSERAEEAQAAAAQRMTWAEIMADPEYNAQMQAVVQQRLKGAKRSQQDMQTLQPALELLAKQYGVVPGDHAALVQAISEGGEKARRQDLQAHFAGLQQQAQKLKEIFPDFDLRQQMQNPAFARLTAPGSGLTLEDAYYALNRQQLQGAAMELAARQTAKKLASAVASGSARPQEHGVSRQAAAAPVFDYRNASRQEKEELKRRIALAAARGEKVYPEGV